MERRHDIDWLRVIAIILVLYFHVAMIFTEEWGWHIKNEQLSYLFLEFNFWLSRFRMPLLFFISGFGTYLALRKRSGWTYLKERNLRLLIPLVFSMFFIVPPQIYMERIFNDPASYASFMEFYPETFKFQVYPNGNFSWHHMWFVAYLLFYSIVGLPLFLYLRKANVQFRLQRILNIKGVLPVLVLVVPTVLSFMLLMIGRPRTNDFINDWHSHVYWMTFFTAGYLVGIIPSFWKNIVDNRRAFFMLAITAIVLINYARWNSMEPGDGWKQQVYFLLYPINTWSWILAFLGYARVYLNKPSRILKYMNRAIYPFYILHQTIIIIIGFYIIQVPETPGMKFLIISTLSLFFTLFTYEYLIRPFKVSRFLFGVKEVKPTSQKGRADEVKVEKSYDVAV